MSHMNDWATSNGFRLNTSKTQCLIICKKSYTLHFHSPSLLPHQQNFVKIFGVVWNSNLSWGTYFESVEKTCSKRMYLLRRLRSALSHNDLWSVFESLIVSVLTYAIELFGPLSFASRDMIGRIYKRAKRIICKENCACNYPISFETIHLKRVLKLFEKSQKLDHPLYPIVCHPIVQEAVLAYLFRSRTDEETASLSFRP